MASFVVAIQGMAEAHRVLDQYIGRPFEKSIERALMAGAKVAARAIRRAAPKGKTGNLKSASGRARLARSRPGLPPLAIAGPAGGRGKGGHRHLVIRGHRIVTHAGADTGLRSRPNPFVDRAVEPIAGLIVEAVKRELRK